MKTFADLVDALRRLHVIDAEPLDALARRYAGQNPDPRQVAKQLVQQGLLTHYQANQLFKGRGQELVLGSYVLLEAVGEGGMGTVYKARNWKLGQVVAVKRIRPERLANEAAKRRFQREIRASAILDHPNIVRAIDAADIGENQLLVMEFVPDGRDLNRIVREQGPLPVAEACIYARQVALGLQHAHECGLVHRDIKPHNVLVTASATGALVTSGGAGGAGSAGAAPGPGVAKILDFGLARLGEGEDSTTLTKEGAVMGTVDYLAPEQARNAHDADIRADLYSLGCTIYYVLAGRAPFVGGTAPEKIYKHQFEEPTPIEMVRLDVPPGLGHIVRKLMAKRPADRYQTPAELIADLDAYGAGRPTSAAASSVRVAPPSAAIVSATPATHATRAAPAAQATQDTDNPFAALSASDTSADGPVSVRLRQTPAAPVTRNRALVFGIAGAAAALFFLVAVSITAALLLHRRGPQVAEGPDLLLPPHKTTPRDRDKTAAPTKDKGVASSPEVKPDPKSGEPGDPERAAAAKKWLAAEEGRRAERVKAADEAFKAVDTAFHAKDVTFAAFAKEVAAFKTTHGGTPAALRAAALLGRLRSPLDALDSAKLSADAQAALDAWQRAAAAGMAPAPAPGELVAVRGDQRGRHWGTIAEVQFVDDGKYVLSAGAGTIMLMDAETRAIVAIFPQMDVWAVSPNNKLLATGSFDGLLQLYDVEGKRSLWHTEAFVGGGVHALCFAPDGKTVLAGGGLNRARNANAGYLVRVWDTASGKPRGLSALDNEINSLAFSPDGTVLAAATAGGNVCLVNPRKLQEPPAVFPSPGGVGRCLLAPDGKTLAARWGGKLRLYDVATKRAIVSVDDLNADFDPRDMFTSDGRTYVIREATGIRAWSLPKGDLVGKWEAHPDGGVAAAAIANDDKELWTGSSWHSGEIKVWDLATGKMLRSMPGYEEPQRSVTDIRMAPDGKVVAWLCGGKNVRLWRRDKNVEQATIRRLDGGPFAFSADGKRVVTADGNIVRVWDAQTGLEKPALPGRSPVLPGLAFAPDARLVLAADTRGIVRRWSLSGGSDNDIPQWTARTYNGQAPRLAFLRDGQRFVTFGEGGELMRWHLAAEGGFAVANNLYGCCVSPNARFALINQVEGHVAIWDLDPGTAKEIGSIDRLNVETPELQRVADIAVTPDERHAVLLHGVNRPRSIRICAIDTGKEVFRFKPNDCARVAVAPDGQHLVTTDYDGAVSLFDLHTGSFVRKIDIGPDLAPQPALFSPDGKLAAFVYRTTVAVVEVPTGNRVKEWPMPGAVDGIAFAPDGRHLAAGNSNGTIYLMRLPDAAAPTKTASTR